WPPGSSPRRPTSRAVQLLTVPQGGQRGESTVTGHERKLVKVPGHPEELLRLGDLALELVLCVIVNGREPELDEKLGLLGRAETADEAEARGLAQAMGPPAGTVDRPFGHGEVVEPGMLSGIGGVGGGGARAVFGRRGGGEGFLWSSGGGMSVIAHGVPPLNGVVRDQKGTPLPGRLIIPPSLL